MAVKPFSKEQLNFFKFSTLVLDDFPKVLRQIFITMWDSKVAVRPGFIPWDDSTTVRNMLLKSEGGKTDIPTTKSIDEWDCTALFKATIYAKTFGVPGSKGSTLNDLYLKKIKPLPGSFHSSVQSSTGNQDETYALAIDQLRLLRNTLCHSPKAEIVKTDFDNYVQLVTNALAAVNVDTAFVDTIGQMSEDDFPTERVQELHECLLNELRANSVFHENMEQKLSSIDVRTDEIHTMMKNMNLGEKRIVAETLPKPYVPSAVPLFTGREDEIEEITDLISGQLTRLLNIWGSPGFGKTSTAIEAARNLLSLGWPVYFFELQGIKTLDEFLSKILSIFKSNLADLSLRPIDKLVSIFRELSSQIFLIFDNLDDLLSSESSSVKLTFLFVELLNSNVNINIVFTTRELLENMRDQIEGFLDIRIRPLHPVSSVKFVRQLLPSFSESVVANVARICSYVPLAMKLAASLVEYNTEDMANKILQEVSLSGNLLDQLDSPYERNMKRLFEIPFEQLTLTDKHALISLSVFSSCGISKDAAIDVVSGEMGVAKAVRSLKTLVKKSLIDEDPCRECYSIHPLILSFVVDKAKQSDFENVFQSASIRFCRYYFLLFERINDDFLSGKSVDNPQLQDAMMHLSIAIHYFMTTTCSLENFQDLFRILSKSEIFLFLIDQSLDIPKLYDFAIEKCRTQQYNYAYSKLYVSKYFQSIASGPHCFSAEYIEIPEHIREDVMLLSDGSAAKLGCYEGISIISKGSIKSGMECIEKYVDGLQNCADQQLIKCLCLQLLALFYTDLEECNKSSELRREAIEVCKEIGNYNLFVIGDCEESLSATQKEYEGEQLIVFVYLLFLWSKQILSDETQLYFLNFVHQLEQQLENKTFNTSPYLVDIFVYCDGLLAWLGICLGQKVRFDEKITFLKKSVMSDDCCSLTDETFSTMSEVSSSLSPQRLLNCYTFQMIVDDKENEQGPNVLDTCRNALDLSLKQCGKQHWRTAFCYLKMGLAENNAENYISALNSFDQAVEIMTATHDLSSSSNAVLADVYIGKGEAYKCLNKFESAIASFEEALRIKRKLCDEGTEEIAQILVLLGNSQLCLNDLSSSLATLDQVLQIRKKLYAEKPSPNEYIYVVLCFYLIGDVHNALGNNTESIKYFKTALEVSTDCDQERSIMQSCICVKLINLNVDENVYMELLESNLPMIKGNYRSFLPILYLRLGLIQITSRKFKAGLASFQEALDIELDITLRSSLASRESTVSCYLAMVVTLVNIGKFKLASKAIERATQVAESLPECRQNLWIFRCYSWKGRIQIEMREYITAIDSLKHALLQLPKILHESCDKLEVFECHKAIAAAYFFVGSYKDALTAFYDALSVIKDIFPEGSVAEAQVYLFVAKSAQNMKNKTLEVSNFRLAYKMYSKVLGEAHSQTQITYIAYARALISLR